MQSFGDILKALREKNGKKQEDVARFLQISRATISNYESGNREPDMDTIKELSKFFKVSTDYLLGLTDNPLGHHINSNLNHGFLMEAAELVPDIYNKEKSMDFSSKNIDFKRIEKKIIDHSIDIKTIEKIVDNLIALKANDVPK